MPAGQAQPASRTRRTIQLRPPVTLPAVAWRVDAACRLDREADAEIMLGHHERAEFLANQAAALRGAA